MRTNRRPLSRKAKLIGATVGVVLVWQVGVVSLAAGRDELAPTSYVSESQAAVTKAADQHLSDGDAPGAKILAAKALAMSPISAQGLRDLGLAEQQLGNWQQAGALFSQSAALGWRDVPSQLWLAQAFLQKKAYGEAAERLDAALRTAPDSTYLYSALDGMLADPSLAKAMANRLTLNPHWRFFYLSFAHEPTLDATQAKARLLTDLVQTDAPPSRDEMLTTLAWLIRYDQAPSARALWMMSQHAPAGTLYDPGFNAVQSDGASPFEWAQLRVPGGGIQVDAHPGAGLQVSTDGTATGAILQQTVLLSPGPHDLGLDGAIAGKAASLFGWQVRCTSSGEILLDTLQLPPKSTYRFTVPGNCMSQRVELRVTSSSSASDLSVSLRRLWLS